jgi:hypothetical protein
MLPCVAVHMSSQHEFLARTQHVPAGPAVACSCSLGVLWSVDGALVAANGIVAARSHATPAITRVDQKSSNRFIGIYT